VDETSFILVILLAAWPFLWKPPALELDRLIVNVAIRDLDAAYVRVS
jgi:hypothetical protein